MVGTDGPAPDERRSATSRSPLRTVVGAAGLVIALAAGAWALGHRADPEARRGERAVAAQATAEPLGRSVAGLQDRLRADPDNGPGWAALALAYVDEARVTGDTSLYGKADGSLQRSFELRPAGNVPALTARAALANARHDFSGGLRAADEAAAIEPANPNVQIVRGDALLELGRYGEAFTAYQQAADRAPGLASYTRAAYALELQGQLEGARRSLELARGEAIAPKDIAFAEFSLGELAWNRGDLDGARRHYAHAARADPAAVGPQAGLARIHAAAADTAQAIEQWQDVVGRAPLPEYVAELGNLYQRSGRAAEAQQQFELLGAQRALLKANGVNGDLELALFSADHGVDLGAGLAAAQAEWTRHRSIHAADALAWQLHANGRHAEALPLADEALRLGTRNALFLFHRGMIHLALGDRPAAGRDLAAALAVNPHFSVLHAPAARTTLDSFDRRAATR